MDTFSQYAQMKVLNTHVETSLLIKRSDTESSVNDLQCYAIQIQNGNFGHHVGCTLFLESNAYTFFPLFSYYQSQGQW